MTMGIWTNANQVRAGICGIGRLIKTHATNAAIPLRTSKYLNRRKVSRNADSAGYGARFKSRSSSSWILSTIESTLPTLGIASLKYPKLKLVLAVPVASSPTTFP